MAAQPLETIPEEPTPAPTPPNAPARVTADPPQTKPAKNAGRVASRKRLAERNRLASEAKKKAQDSSTTPASVSATASDNNSSLSLMTVLGIGGLLVSVAGVYYQREAIKERFNPAPPTPPTPPTPPAPSPTPAKRGIKKME